MSESMDPGAVEAPEAQTGIPGAEGAQAAPTSGDKAAIVKDVIGELGEADMDKIVTIKVNGKEERIPLREALKISRMEKASQAKMQEAAVMQKQFQQVMALAKSNPREFLQRTGIDPYEFAESTLAEKYELMQMTPEQRKTMEYQQRLKTYEDKEKADKQNVDQRQQSEARSKIQGELEKDIVDAWKESGLPRHKYFAARISAEMLSSLAQKKAGYREEALHAKDAAAIVKEQVVAELKDIILSVAKTDPAAAQKLLGDDILKILRDHDVKRVTGNSASSASNQNRPASQAASGRNQASKSMNDSEWKEYWKKL
jgi:hypothetical protein